MNVKTFKEQAAEWAKECTDIVTSANEKVNVLMDNTFRQFAKNTLDNIPQHFGKFLYTVLGDRITGQRSSVVNNTFLTHNEIGKRLLKDATDNGKTIEETYKDFINNTSNPYLYKVNGNPPQLYITTGRKFGVSYPNGKNNDKVHTIYFDEENCFEYLTFEHIQCIKNKDKKQCTQDFYDFREEFISGLKGLTQLIPVLIPAKQIVISKITKQLKLQPYGTADHGLFCVIQDELDINVTHLLVVSREINVWDKITSLNSHSVGKHHNPHYDSYISLIFLNIDDTNKKITNLGNFDMDTKTFRHSLQTANNVSFRDIQNHVDSYERISRLLDMPVFKAYQSYAYDSAVGYIVNMDFVLQNPVVIGELQKRITFYTDMSEKLQNLKTKYSDMYFINSDV